MPVLQFKGKATVENHHYIVPHHTLEFDPKLSVLPKGQKPSLDGNLIIEGDNLLALKALLPTHAGKMKCVYIDPPYNTGEENWVYNDKLTQPQFKEWIGNVVGKEGEDACRHDKWCCMMYPRLALLRELLRNDGVLFVSIDENEAGNLRFLLDEIFQVEMPLATFVWKRRSSTGMRADPVSVDHEYVFLYAKDRSAVELSGTVMTEADYPYEDKEGRYASTDLTVGMTREERPNQYYDLVNDRTGSVYPPNPDRVWRFEPGEMKNNKKANLIIWPEDFPDRDMHRPRFKTRFDPKNPKIKPVSSWITGKGQNQEDSEENGGDRRILDTGLNSEGGRVLRQMFGKKVFNYPKPPSLIHSLVVLATKGDDLVLDSFAGSGTTGEAVLKANASDGNTRQFVLIQQKYDNKEQEEQKENICETVTAPRIKKVINGYEYGDDKRKRKAVSGLGGFYSYMRLGNPLFGEYRDLGDKPPAFDEVAKYVFFTETSQEYDPKDHKKKTGRIGEVKGTAYFLLYDPDKAVDWPLDTAWLDSVGDEEKCKSLVVYCEKFWLHRDDLAKWQKKAKKTVRPMLVPFHLR
jgi:DNA modification methylase